MIFVLMFVLAFVAAGLLIPYPYGLVAIGVILVGVALFHCVKSLNQTAHSQIFDRIKLRRFGVEYCAGTFGDSWSRPYNEFRVELVQQNWFAFNLYKVRLKHRVLPNLLVESTRSRDRANQTVSDLIKNSPLKLLKTED